MKQKIVIFSILFLIIAGVIAMFVFSKPNRQITTTQPGQKLPINPPKITSFYPNPGIVYNLKVDSFNPPNELPLIKITPPTALTEDEVKQIAKTAGLTADNFKLITNGERQRLYIFNSNNAYLTIYADTGKISYRNYENLTNSKTNLNENEIISKAKDFLVNKFSFKADTLNLSSINRISNNEYTVIQGPAQPQFYYEVNFAPVLTDYKLVTTNPEQSPIKVTIADDGTIGKAEIVLVYQATLSTEKYALKSFDDLKNQINKAVILQARTDEYHGQYFPIGSITRIEVDHIEVAYLDDTSIKINYYQPVFLLQGTGKSSIVISPIQVTLYLPAIKN